MKKTFTFISVALLFINQVLNSQGNNNVEVFLLTCGPGSETYSRWGHSALRILDHAAGTDKVYNWGIFDFDTPAFAWKFARGSLEYMLGVTSYKRFLEEYFMEGRWVQSQKVNLKPEETDSLLELIAENLKPENIKYRYDFFYDDCSTRIRDLLEKSIDNKLLYMPGEKQDQPTFRSMIDKYLQPAPWLEFGIDLLMGISGDKKASIRDRMFLPIDMQEGLSDAFINRDGKMIPLLQNPETVLESDSQQIKRRFMLTPIILFSAILIIIILLSGPGGWKNIYRIMDIFLFSVFAILAMMMIFFNFFTDHQQMKWNLNIVWISPFIILCLLSILFNKSWHLWFRIVFVLCVIYFAVLIVFPNASNNGFVPLLLILVVRSSARAGFTWNPLSVSEEN